MLFCFENGFEGAGVGEGGQKIQTSSYKITPGDIMYGMVTIII